MKKAILIAISAIGLSLLAVGNSWAESEEVFSIQDGKLIIIERTDVQVQMLDIFNGNVAPEEIPFSIIKKLVEKEGFLHEERPTKKRVGVNHWAFPIEIIWEIIKLSYVFNGQNIVSTSPVETEYQKDIAVELYWRMLVGCALLTLAVILYGKDKANRKFAYTGCLIFLGVFTGVFTGELVNGFAGGLTSGLAGGLAGGLTGLFAGLFAGLFTGKGIGVFTGILAVVFAGGFAGEFAGEFGYSAAGINEYLIFLAVVLAIGFLIINSKSLIHFFKDKYFLKSA